MKRLVIILTVIAVMATATMAMAVPGSLAPVPWSTLPTAQVLLEMINLDGSPLESDPRNVLRRAMKPLADIGLKPVLATELEFYLVEHDGHRSHLLC